MNRASKVTTIDAKPMFIFDKDSSVFTKRKVAAYARVSTDEEEQQNSYEAQIEYYTKYITARTGWEFMGIYADEGLTATSMKRRDGFNQMVRDALDGKVQMIVTKSISRFARNTVDSLITIRKLKEHNIEIFFEKEAISTLDGKGELLVTIMSSLAQEESRSISENVRWGIRQSFAEGNIRLPYKHFLGYEKGDDDLPQIVESEAEIVRLIYKLTLEGKSPGKICTHLMKQDIPSPAGKPKWYTSTVMSILTNEKYCGSALLQKRFCTDFLTKKMKINEGEVPQYYIKESHPPIIAIETFELVQSEIAKRKQTGVRQGSSGCFSSKVFCGECGSMYGSKVWHSTSKYRKTVWHCNARHHGNNCTTPTLHESELQQLFVDAFNGMIENKAQLFCEYRDIIDELMDLTGLDSNLESLQAESIEVTEKLRQELYVNQSNAQDQDGYNKRRKPLEDRYRAVTRKINEIISEKERRSARQIDIYRMIEQLSRQDTLLDVFDEELWYATVDRMTVHNKSNVVVKFKSGREVTVEVRVKS